MWMKYASGADFMRIITFSIQFPHPHWHILLHPSKKDRFQRIQRRQAAFLVSLIFLIAASHAASIFLCCVYGSHSFPYFFNYCKPCSFLFFYAAFYGLLFPLLLSLSIILEHSRCRASGDFLIFSLRSSSCHAAVRQPAQPELRQRDDA